MNNPVLWTKFNTVSRHDAKHFADEYSAEIGRMSGRCIDIGSGTCDVAVDFILPKLKPKSSLVCSDISEAMMNYGKKKYGDDDRLSFIQLDIETQNLPKDLIGQFDHVTSCYCLHWCLDLHQAISNIYRLLRPGGTVFLTFIANSESLDAFKILQAVPKYQAYAKDAERITPPFQDIEQPREAMMSILADNGFQVHGCSYRMMNHIFDDADYLKEFLFALSPFEMDSLPAELRDAYSEDLMKEFSKRSIVFNKDQNNTKEMCVLYRFNAFVVHLRKPMSNYLETLEPKLSNGEINVRNNFGIAMKPAIV